MLDTEVIDLLNSRALWGFIGSGTSIDAGVPDWQSLVLSILRSINRDARERVAKDPAFVSAIKVSHYPRALSRIVVEAGRSATIQALAHSLNSSYTPGPLTQAVARWPFKSYITTNYDNLLEVSLAAAGNDGWIPLGNNHADSRLTTRNARDVVWHLHGGINVIGSSNFVLTEEDYDDIYKGDAQQLEHLRSLLMQQRVLFVGFGFRDHDLMKQLELVGSMCNPVNPAFAFVPDSISQKQRNTLFDLYNVKSLVYPNADGTHRGLATVMQIYNSFVVARGFSFSNSVQKTPSHDPETTSLFLYNELVMKRQAPLEEAVLLTLAKARVLSILRYRGHQSAEEFTAELEAKLVSLASDSEFSPYAFQDTLKLSLKQLSEEGLIVSDAESKFDLTPPGVSKVDERSVDATLLERGFIASLRARAQTALPSATSESWEKIQDAAFAFFTECVRMRAVGVAKSLFRTSDANGEFHILSLLASLPNHMKRLAGADEALGLVRVVTDVLTHPSDKEGSFLGAALQAQFALVILGYAPELVKARVQLISQMAFIFDSASLISLLARGSEGNRSSVKLLSLVQTLGGTTICTGGLVDEVAEHARWVQNEIGHGIILSEKTLRTMLSSSGSRSNLFLEGAVQELTAGAAFTSFDDYLNSIFSDARGSSCRPDVTAGALGRLGVPCFEPANFEGFEPEDLAEEEAFMKEIETLRKIRDTYTHTRQVQTEARVVIFIRLLRSGKYRISGTNYRDAFFISNSRVLDRLKDSTLPMTMVPAALHQWLMTLAPCEPFELRVLFDGLMLELEQRGYSIVNKNTVQRAFSPLIDLSRERLQEEVEKHRTLTASMYGQDSSEAFQNVTPLDSPLTLNSFYAQRAHRAESALVVERNAKEIARRTATISEKERNELARLRAEKAQRKIRNKSKKRAALSRKKPNKKKIK
ncbi:MAG TPA: SIR2 family protein [Edaphobacter sp.]|nr:SIR2 family protein [Edaphobacter sp.]